MATIIECQQIPKIQLDILSRTLLAAIERYYADPENQKRYEAWLHSEEGEAYVNRNSARESEREKAPLI